MKQEEQSARTGNSRRAHQELTGGGDDLLAAEMMWRGFCNCLITVGLNNGLPHDSHGALRYVAQQMDATRGGDTRRPRFDAAERLHRHFYHGDIPARLMRAQIRTFSVQNKSGHGRQRQRRPHCRPLRPRDGMAPRFNFAPLSAANRRRSRAHPDQLDSGRQPGPWESFRYPTERVDCLMRDGPQTDVGLSRKEPSISTSA